MCPCINPVAGLSGAHVNFDGIPFPTYGAKRQQDIQRKGRIADASVPCASILANQLFCGDLLFHAEGISTTGSSNCNTG